MRKSADDKSGPIDPMFDGHLEQPAERMTLRERLRWAWEGTLLLDWARRARIQAGRALPDDLDDNAGQG